MRLLPIYISKSFKDIDSKCYLVFLGMIYATIFFCSFVMGYKTITFYGRILCSSVFVFPLLFPLNDSITEIIGAKVSYFMILAIIICEFTFSIVTNILSSFPSPINWKNQEMYPLLTNGFIHIAIADSLSLAIGFFANTYVLDKWGIKLFGANFFLRSLGATAIGEFFFTVLTNLTTFYFFEMTNIWDTTNIIISDYIFKMLYSIIICFPNAYIVNKIKNSIKNENNEYLNDKVIEISRARMSYRN